MNVYSTTMKGRGGLANSDCAFNMFIICPERAISDSIPQLHIFSTRLYRYGTRAGGYYSPSTTVFIVLHNIEKEMAVQKDFRPKEIQTSGERITFANRSFMWSFAINFPQYGYMNDDDMVWTMEGYVVGGFILIERGHVH